MATSLATGSRSASGGSIFMASGGVSEMELGRSFVLKADEEELEEEE